MSDVYLVIMGWGSIKKTFAKLVKSAPNDAQVFVISGVEMMPGSLPDELNKNLIRFLDKHGFEKVNLIGHSMGGALALQFAYHYPEKVQHLYLIDSEGIYDQKPFYKMAWKFIQGHTNFFLSDIPLLLMASAAVLRTPIWHTKMSHFAHHIDLQREAAALKVPTTLLWGEDDGAIPLWQGKKLHELIPNSKLITLPKMNHDWILKHPDKFWQHI